MPWQFTCVGHTIQPVPPTTLTLAVAEFSSRKISSSRRWRDVVSAASDPTVTSRARADRLLRTEPQVLLTTQWPHRTITQTSSLSRTYLSSLGQLMFGTLHNPH